MVPTEDGCRAESGRRVGLSPLKIDLYNGGKANRLDHSGQKMLRFRYQGTRAVLPRHRIRVGVARDFVDQSKVSYFMYSKLPPTYVCFDQLS